MSEKYEFSSLQNLVDFWCRMNYFETTVLAIFDSKDAFESLPILAILKRDNFKVYNTGINSEFLFIEFESAERAYDFVMGFQDKYKTRWTIYKHGVVYANSK
jgi:hypothetical protein